MNIPENAPIKPDWSEFDEGRFYEQQEMDAYLAALEAQYATDIAAWKTVFDQAGSTINTIINELKGAKADLEFINAARKHDLEAAAAAEKAAIADERERCGKIIDRAIRNCGTSYAVGLLQAVAIEIRYPKGNS